MNYWSLGTDIDEKECGVQRSIRYGSWFSSSKSQSFFGLNTIADWRSFTNEVILDHVEESTEAIGGVGKIVEVDESKFGKRKYRGLYGECYASRISTGLSNACEAVQQAISEVLVEYYQKYVDEASKKEDIFVQYDRSLLVAGPR
ncbi:hypothetical protein TNIN_280121 [Trichonephila inaurata madagascariensis]|uniref:Uncharacterized protein n=1 Tax=Trichonephila inaurata madagascariensis TaxID=2747483 RepID=A0A8X7BYZ1_9ARAC|nr:hypothetical protein TNIN_280121 [Trichonephila inaurata madagascariensis]